MKASAHIQVTLEIPILDTWPDGTDISEVRKQSIASGMARLQQIFTGVERPRIVGEPKVTIVLVEDL